MENQAPELSNPSADLVAAFANAQPMAAAPIEQPPVFAPEVPAPADVVNPPAAAVESGAVSAPPVVEPPAPQAPDYNAWLKSEFDADPETVKQGLAARQQLTQAQADIANAAAVRELLADPVKLREFADLTTQDFGKLATEAPKDVLLAQFRATRPDMPANVAQILFDREFSVKYPGLNFEDPEDATYQSDSRILAYEAAQAAKFMTDKQTEARKILEAPAQPAVPEGPPAMTEEESNKQFQIVESLFEGFEGFDFDVDGQKVSMPVSNPAALKEAVIDFGGFIMPLVSTDGKYDPAKAQLIAYKLLEDTNSHAAKAAKGSTGPVVPMAALVNNPSATAPPTSTQGDRAGLLEALAAASRSNRGSTY